MVFCFFFFFFKQKTAYEIVSRDWSSDVCSSDLTGGGAYLNAETRELMRDKAVTVWLNADLETLWKRVSRRNHRPLLRRPDAKEVLSNLFDERRPIYELADLTVHSVDGPHSKTVTAIIKALESWTPQS